MKEFFPQKINDQFSIKINLLYLILRVNLTKVQTSHSIETIESDYHFLIEKKYELYFVFKIIV